MFGLGYGACFGHNDQRVHCRYEITVEHALPTILGFLADGSCHLTSYAGVEAGLHQAVGSVNIIRGGSQRSGMSAMNLIRLGQADCLCSDYVPATLLPAMLKIVTELDLPLHKVAELVTSNPAKAARLTDRGTIQPGMKADLFAFDQLPQANFPPRVRATWSNGRLAFLAKV